MTVGLGVGLAVGAGFRSTAVVAQAGAAAVTATARVLPGVGLFPRGVEASPAVDRPRSDSWRWAPDGDPGPGLPSTPATTVTRQAVGNRRVIELAAIGV